MDKPDKPGNKDRYQIDIDGKIYQWEKPAITGAQIKELARVDLNSFDVWQEVRGSEDKLIENKDTVDLTDSDVERFFTGTRHTTEGSQ